MAGYVLNGVIDLLICVSICNTMYNNNRVEIVTSGLVVEFRLIDDNDFSVSSSDSDTDLSINQFTSTDSNFESFERRLDYATEQSNIEASGGIWITNGMMTS